VNYKLYAVRIFSLNWQESFNFYRDTLGLSVWFNDAESGWAQFDLGGVYLGLERCEPTDSETRQLVGRFVGVSLRVSNIEQIYSELRTNGVEFIAPPEKQVWGGTLAHFKDPDANVLTLLAGDF